MAIFAYASIMMTYFGVNFYLTGLHSYASGDVTGTENIGGLVGLLRDDIISNVRVLTCFLEIQGRGFSKYFSALWIVLSRDSFRAVPVLLFYPPCLLILHSQFGQ